MPSDHQISNVSNLPIVPDTQIPLTPPPVPIQTSRSNQPITPTETSKTLQIYSLAYHPTIQSETLEGAHIGIFPTSMANLVDITSPDGSPLIFMVLGEEEVKPIYVVGHEFSAPEGTCYLPRDLMSDGFLADGSSVTVNTVQLPKVTKITLQAKRDAFAEKTTNPKGDLEKVIVGQYQVLALYDPIEVNGELLEVIELEPAEVVSTFNSDPTVEFQESRESLARIEEQVRNKVVSEDTPVQDADRPEEHSEWTPFCGSGRRLDGGVVGDTSESSSNQLPPSARGVSNSIIRRATPTVRITNKYQSFAGTGHQLGNK